MTLRCDWNIRLKRALKASDVSRTIKSRSKLSRREILEVFSLGPTVAYIYFTLTSNNKLEIFWSNYASEWRTAVRISTVLRELRVEMNIGNVLGKTTWVNKDLVYHGAFDLTQGLFPHAAQKNKWAICISRVLLIIFNKWILYFPKQGIRIGFETYEEVV